MQTATDVGDELLGARLSPLARLLVIAASVIIILAGLKAAAEIAAPILFAIFLATLTSPLLQGLENRGLSTARALAVMIAGTLALGGGFVALIYLSVRQILILPSAANAGALGAARSSLAGLGLNGTLEPANILSDRFVLQASSAILQLVILITLFVFFLIAFPRFRSTELADHVDSSPLFAPLLAVRQDLWSFLAIRTKVNAFMAIPATIFLVAAGIDFALLWGVLLFVFSFIPYIGFTLATIPPALLGWIEYGPIGAIAVVLVFVILNVIAEYVLFPRYAGKGLNIPPWVVLVSVFFWGWLLGALGTLIAVPITLLIRVLLSNFTVARWLVDVLGGDATNIRSDDSPDPAIASK
jgi:predicted PurR-regulated permease PerM